MVLPVNAFDYSIKRAGQPLLVRYYTESYPSTGSVWDASPTFTKSGNDLYISGLIQEISENSKSSNDAILLEEGRLRYGDIKVYISGGIQTTSGVLLFTITPSGPSPLMPVYREVAPGLHAPSYYGLSPYKKVYMRESYEGSLF